MMRAVSLLSLLALATVATPAAAIQEVTLSPRAPSFATGQGASLGWETLAMPGAAPSFAPAPALRDPRGWAFTSGKTEQVGAFLFNTTTGPNWAMGGPFGGLSAFRDLGFTTRQTTAVMAAENLMFYTSLGRTTFASGPSAVVPPIGLGLTSTPSAQMDMRAGFKVELMPGFTFQAEAAFAPAMR
jgi:hypothetical protein